MSRGPAFRDLQTLSGLASPHPARLAFILSASPENGDRKEVLAIKFACKHKSFKWD